MKIASYIFGAIAMLSLLLAYQQSKRERLIIHKLVADACWAIHYFLLGAYGGVVPNIVGIFREIVFLKRDTSKRAKRGAGRFAIPMIFIVINWILGALTFKKPINILPIAASMFVTVSLWMKNPKLTKAITLPVCTAFLVYDLLIGSYIGAANETISICSIAVNFTKNQIAARQKRKRNMQNENLFLQDCATKKKPVYIKEEPIRDYGVFVEPHKDAKAIALGKKLTEEINANYIADFEKDEAYCRLHGGNVDLMCHVSTLYKIDGKIYVTYYANDSSAEEDPLYQAARIAYCPENDVSAKTILTVQKVGDTVGGKTVDKVYDTIMFYEGGNLVYVLWTASLDGKYYRLARTFDIHTETFGEVMVNRLKVGSVLCDFSTSGIESAFAENGIAQKRMFNDIGIMQKLSYRVENGETYYYSGAYSGYLTFVIKTKDFLTWEYVATPDFVSLSLWENATYVLNDKVFYFVRQRDCNQGFLTYYDLNTGKWQQPSLIADCQSRADFFLYRDNLYLVNAPLNREGIAITKIDLNDLTKIEPIAFADLKTSIFYPFVRVYGNELYLSYTVARKHIRLTKIDLKNYV